MDPLAKYRKNVTSQWGEDGIIEEILERLKMNADGEKRTCVEFGAWDGKHMSNTWRLWHDKGWDAMLIEGDRKRWQNLKEDVKPFSKVIAHNAFVRNSGPNSLDSILENSNIRQVDLLSIDID